MPAQAISCNLCKYYEKATSMCLQYQTVVNRPTIVYKYCPMGELMASPSISSSRAEPVSANSSPKKSRQVKPRAKGKVKKKVARRAPEPGMVKVPDNSSAEGQTTH
jgi:hypothetical protein